MCGFSYFLTLYTLVCECLKFSSFFFYKMRFVLRIYKNKKTKMYNVPNVIIYQLNTHTKKLYHLNLNLFIVYYFFNNIFTIIRR